MIAVDTNVLVYAHRPDSEWHRQAAARVRELSEGAVPWAIPWQCVHEFLSVITHPRIFSPPTPVSVALDAVAAWLETPALVLLGEERRHWDILHRLLAGGLAVGPRVYDARIAAVCLAHGVRELWSADRDFGRFPELRVRNPLIPNAG